MHNVPDNSFSKIVARRLRKKCNISLTRKIRIPEKRIRRSSVSLPNFLHSSAAIRNFQKKISGTLVVTKNEKQKKQGYILMLLYFSIFHEKQFVTLTTTKKLACHNRG